MFSPIRLDARNPGAMTGSGNGTYLLAARGGSALLIDAGVGHPDHLQEIGSELLRLDAMLDRVAITHWHSDHAGGVPELARTWPNAGFAKYPWPREDGKIGVPFAAVKDGDGLSAGSETLIAVHTPGHAPDHLAFWHQESRTLFAGDLVVLGSTVMIDWSRGGDLGQYLASLERVRRLKPARLFPAHGPAIEDPEALLKTYIDHRLLRERQVLAELANGRDTVSSIAESIYHGLAAALMPAAHETVRAHLEKLKQDGRVIDTGERWQRR